MCVLRSRLRWRAVCALCAWLAGVSVGWAQVEPPEPRPLLEYRARPQMLADGEPFRVAVYPDGSVIVDYPAHMKKAGRYTLRLDRAGLARILDLARRAAAFDAQAVRAQVEALRRRHVEETGVLRYRSDPLLETFSLAPSLAGGASERVLTWPNVVQDASEYGEIGALRSLADLQRALRGLAERPELRRVRP